MSVRLITLGPPQCYLDDTPTDLPAQKLRFALLVYLAIQGRVAREAVTAMFWGERDDEHARHALSQAIYELRRALGEDWLKAQTDPLTTTDTLTVDVVEFEAAARRGDLAHALQLYQGDFLEGFHVKASNEFESWISSRRNELKRLHHRAARDYISRLTAAGDSQAALLQAFRWVEIDPLDDEANHAAIELLAQTGQRAEALAHFEEYQQRLKEQLAVQPLDQTRELVARIRRDTALGVSTSVPAALNSEAGKTPSAASSWGFLSELKHRRVIRMALWYGATAVVMLQAVDVMIDALFLPAWLLTATAVLAVFALPLALVMAWQFDITADGLIRTRRLAGWSLKWRGHRLFRFAGISLLVLVAAGVAGMYTDRGRTLVIGSRTVLCANLTPGPCFREVPVDPRMYVVLPLAHRDGVASELIDGEACAQYLTDGLERWGDILTADPLQVSDVLQRREIQFGSYIPLDTGLAVAKNVGAGKLIMGELIPLGDSTRVRVSLYDVSQKGKRLQTKQTSFPHGSPLAQAAFHALARAMLVAEAGADITDASELDTRSFAALLAYDSAIKAVKRWQLDTAVVRLRSALKRDPVYAQAHYWLATIMLWQRDTTAEWRDHARLAAALKQRLGINEQGLATGLAALAAGDYKQACDSYRAVLSRDSLDFVAWHGLGECLYVDPVVLPDSASRSGWSFRSSYHSALDAYQRALALVPSAQEHRSLGASSLRSALLLAPNQERRGFAEHSDSLLFAGYLGIEADTFSLVPYPLHAAYAAAPNVFPTNNAEAIRRQRLLLRDLALEWTRAFPENAGAWETLALALEALGEIRETRPIQNSALAAVRRAGQLNPDREQQLRLQLSEVRLLVKLEQFGDARKRALRVLAAWKEPAPQEARRLAGLAGLVGRGHMMAELLRRAAPDFEIDIPATGESAEPPLELAATAGALLAYASMGGPLDSVQALNRRAHEALTTYVAYDLRTAIHRTTLERAARLTYPLLGPDDVHQASYPVSALVGMQRAVVTGDVAAVRRVMATLDSVRAAQSPTDNASDGVLTEVQLLIRIGDLDWARRKLDAYLDALWTIPPSHFRQAYQPSALVRLMVLRAELGARTGERDVTRRWARAAAELWADADEELEPVVERMKQLARR